MLEQDPLRSGPCTHAGALAAIEGVRLVAGADPDVRRLEAFGQAFKVNALYPDHLSLLREHGIDILCVAAPLAEHCRIVCDAASSGKVRGIYCEKPLARTLEEADRMIETCQDRGAALLIGHERRFAPHFVEARRIVREGVIGSLRTVIGQALTSDPGSLSRRETVGGPLLHDGTHLTDLIGFFCGPASWVIGQAGRSHGSSRVEHTAVGLIGFQNGALGFIEGGGRRDYFSFELELQGELGVLRVGNSPPSLKLSRESRRFSGFRELQNAPLPKARPGNAYVAAFRALIEEIETGNQSASTGRDGRAALEIILALYESAAHGGKKVSLKRSHLARQPNP